MFCYFAWNFEPARRIDAAQTVRNSPNRQNRPSRAKFHKLELCQREQLHRSRRRRRRLDASFVCLSREKIARLKGFFGSLGAFSFIQRATCNICRPPCFSELNGCWIWAYLVSGASWSWLRPPVRRVLMEFSGIGFVCEQALYFITRFAPTRTLVARAIQTQLTPADIVGQRAAKERNGQA